MDRFIKYKKKNLQFGNGYIEMSDDSFIATDKWYPIKNLGTQNCGIYLSNKHSDKLMKCYPPTVISDEYGESILDIILDINRETKLFPDIYNAYKYNGNYYTVMQKLNGDLLSLFYELIPKIVIDNMNRIDIATKKAMFEIFRLKSPTGDLDQIIITDELYYLYNNIEQIGDYVTNYNKILSEAKRTKSRVKFNFDSIEKFVYPHEYELNIDEINTKIKNITNLYLDIKKWYLTQLTSQIYDIFLIRIKYLYRQIIDIVCEKLANLQNSLVDNKFFSMDYKLANYGYVYNGTNINDISTWETDMQFYLLDWDFRPIYPVQDEGREFLYEEILLYKNNKYKLYSDGNLSTFNVKHIDKKYIDSMEIDETISGENKKSINDILSAEYEFKY
jgi:hypothetical protein